MKAGFRIAFLAEAVALAALMGIVFLLGTTWSKLPQRVPVHFNLWGKPDGWGGKDMFLIFAGLAVLAYLFLTIAQRRPGLVNVPFAVDRNDPEVRVLLGEMTTVMKAAVVLLLLGLLWGATQVAMGSADGLGSGMLPLVLAVGLGPMAVYIYRLRRLRLD